MVDLVGPPMGKPHVYEHLREGTDTQSATVECPNCREVIVIREAQYRGDVVIDCPECYYRELHDLSGE